MSVKALRNQLLAAIAMVLVAAIALGSSTFAWFAANTTVQANGMQIRAKSNSTFLLIGEAALTTADQIQNQTGDDLVTEVLTVEDNAAAMYPSKAYGVAETSRDPATADGFNPAEVTTKASAAVEGNWYTANSNAPTVWGGSTQTINKRVLNASEFSQYVIKKTVHLTLADGSTKANNLTVTPNITLKDTYIKTSDIAISDGKTYYTLAEGEYTQVVSPVVADIGTYYEKATDITAVKVLVVSDNNQVVVLDNSMNGHAQNLYGTTNNNLTDTTVHEVDIYIYYDGTEDSVYTNNAVKLSGANIVLNFDVSVNEA